MHVLYTCTEDIKKKLETRKNLENIEIISSKLYHPFEKKLTYMSICAMIKPLKVEKTRSSTRCLLFLDVILLLRCIWL